MSQLLTDLKAVRALLTDPVHWTQGCAARTVHGQPVGPYASDAAKFCLYGACFRAADGRGPDVVAYLNRELGTTNVDIIDVNDTATHQQVLDILDRAIRKEESDEQVTV